MEHSPTLRVGIVGTGFMGRAHAESWRSTPAQLAGFVSRHSVSPLAEEFGVPVFPTIEALLPHIDVLDICTPTPLHLAQTLLAAQAGKHVVCEKPIARTLVDAQAMLDICAANGVQLLIAHVLRFFHAYAAARAQLIALPSGDLRTLHLWRAGGAPEHGGDNWFADLAQSGGPLLDLLIHDYDFARWVAGDVTSVSATAKGTFDDHVHVTLQHASGITTQIEGGWHLAPGAFEAQLRAETRSGQVLGDPTAITASPYALQAQHFYDVLVNGATPLVTAADGLAALRIALAAIESGATGRPVAIT